MIISTAILGAFNASEIVFPMLIPIVAMVIPVVAIITDHLGKKERMRLIEKAIEHGADLDGLNLEEAKPKPAMPYRSGMVTMSIGIALIVGDHYIGIIDRDLHSVLVVAGAITTFIGLALLINDRMNRDRFEKVS